MLESAGRPEPLTPPDCDLRGLPFMPMDVIRVIDSNLFALSTGDEFKAAFSLWCKSWNQVPAASLPNDDRVLAYLSCAKNWKKIKNGAMRGWILCSDDRWYHPVVAEKALEALPMRQHFEEKKSSEATRKAREREERKAMFEVLKTNGIVPDWNIPTKKLREIAQPFTSQSGQDDVTDMSQTSHGQKKDGPKSVTAKTETGTVKGQGQGQLKDKDKDLSTCVDGGQKTALALVPTVPPSEPAEDPIEEIFAYWQKRMDSPRSKLDDKRRKAIKAALKMGYSPADLCRAIRGCSLTPHNMGKNDQNQKYNGIELILRSADQIDRFIANNAEPPAPTVANQTSQADLDAINAKAYALTFGKPQGEVIDV